MALQNRSRRIGASRRRPALLAAALALPLLAAACSTPGRLGAVPAVETERAEPAIREVRYRPNRDPEPFVAAALESYRREQAWLARSGRTGPMPPATFLAVSGGGDDGAFGAGLLVGWTQAGTRPTFKGVTGVSTGALIAPFAFLGPKYDPVLEQVYTRSTDKDIYRKRGLLGALFSDALSDTAPLKRMLDRYVTRELLDEIAAEDTKGRMLLVGTTDLDAREPVIWNMTAIAASKDPQALVLFKKIMLASAAIPAAFPPVMIDVTVDGKRYQEMHVDGGATTQVFLYPPTVRVGEVSREQNIVRERRLYVIRNARLDPDWASVDRRTLSIAGRAVSSLIQTQGLGDLDQLYFNARRDGIDYNLAYIPRDFRVVHKKDFDPAYMRPLFEYGRRLAAGGYPWLKAPPRYGPAGTASAAAR
jgi:hypothetical protein